MGRYIVASTHNKANVSIDILNQQAIELAVTFKNVNVGGWTDTATGEKYIDISTSFNNLEKAIKFARTTKQIAIWDLIAEKEIRIDY